MVTKDKTAAWIEIGLLTASLVALGAMGAAKAWTTATARVVGTTAEAATIAAETTVTAAPTAAQSSAFAAQGASAAMSTLQTGLVRGSQFIEANAVMGRAQLLMAMTGIPFTLMKILEAAADLDSQQNSLPKFNEFAASVMAPIRWPGEKSGYQVHAVEFNGVFQVAGEFTDSTGEV